MRGCSAKTPTPTLALLRAGAARNLTAATPAMSKGLRRGQLAVAIAIRCFEST